MHFHFLSKTVSDVNLFFFLYFGPQKQDILISSDYTQCCSCQRGVKMVYHEVLSWKLLKASLLSFFFSSFLSLQQKERILHVCLSFQNSNCHALLTSVLYSVFPCLHSLGVHKRRVGRSQVNVRDKKTAEVEGRYPSSFLTRKRERKVVFSSSLETDMER